MCDNYYSKKKFGFVILHYQTYKETIGCIDSIINKVDTLNYNIIVVDNNSSNNSGIEIKEYYVKNDKVKVIINSKNLGFAQGNNIGYEYAKKDLQCDFIIMMNNDMLFTQSNFTQRILEEYDESKFAVFGP